MKSIDGIFKILLVLMVGGYLGYLIYYMSVQRLMLFPGAAVPPWDTAANVDDLEKIWLETSGGQVEAWYLPARSAGEKPTPLVIFFHGNGELIDYWPETFEGLRELGIGVLLVEYPGYGRSGGKPSERSIRETALAAYDTAANHPDIDPARIVVYGRSLGGGAACILAEQRQAAALILQSTFSSTAQFARKMLLPGFLVLDRFDNLTALDGYDGPVLVFHSERDDLIPFEHARRLVSAAERGELVKMACVHSDCPPDYTQFWEQIHQFLLRNGILEER